MKIGLIGLGFMGSTHLKALQKITGAELVAVSSDDPRALGGDLSHIQGNLGGPGERLDFSNLRQYSDAYEAARDPEAEAVDLCLPTHLHAGVALEALRSGKHVLVEKPMALTRAEADGMIEEADKAGRILMVAQVLRFYPAYVALREALRSGKLGAVRSALLRRRCAAPAWSVWMGDAARSGGGVFDLLIHDIDMCLHLFGAPEAVSASGHEDLPRGIDFVLAELHYPGIGTVAVTGGWHHPKSYPFSMEYTVTGDDATAEYSSAGRPPALFKADGTSEALVEPEADGYQAEIEYFIECCRTGVKPALCPPEESAASVQLARLILEARERKGEKIACKL
ncbi:MAG: Gfo/Idh/MocA family oxidoreductase [Acidobacteria bacterium]|nr:Gfo/Idh/MocA family oxidoreductase [Acidobacteriota bacterium]